jgi:hypothetical protein
MKLGNSLRLGDAVRAGKAKQFQFIRPINCTKFSKKIKKACKFFRMVFIMIQTDKGAAK